jgi:hypothetical protein
MNGRLWLPIENIQISFRETEERDLIYFYFRDLQHRNDIQLEQVSDSRLGFEE